ncbi:hypothetical protein [Streptomyces sp. NBRC 110028]
MAAWLDTDRSMVRRWRTRFLRAIDRICRYWGRGRRTDSTSAIDCLL